MEKKASIIYLISIAVIVAITCCYIIFAGITTKDYNYVQLEVNPRIEFICDKKFKVVSASPLNNDARVVLSDLNLIGLDVDKASTVFLDECAKTGFIDVNGLNNATNITVLDGITQALDVHVAQEVYKYFRENEILSAITETYEDRQTFNERKDNKISCSNKYKLIKTIIEKNNSQSFEKLRKLKESELVEMVADEHKQNTFVPTQEEQQLKQKLIEDNKKKYTTHKKCISDFSQQEFSKLFDNYQKMSNKISTRDFGKTYTNWQKSHN